MILMQLGAACEVAAPWFVEIACLAIVVWIVVFGALLGARSLFRRAA